MTESTKPIDVRFDEDGFLQDPNQWTPSLAQNIAQQDGFSHLGYKHWIMITTMRKYYFRYYSPPAMHYICHHSHLDPDCAELFHHDMREAWRIAGLPNPGEEARAYL